MQQQVLSDRYELEHLIGSGGMADVYLARDRALGRTVAVKVLHTGYAADPVFVERFRREAQAAARLNHPNVVAIYDWGEITGRTPGYYIVMEYIPGENLREMLVRRGPLPETEALGIAAEVAEALAAAHRQGLVHRDVKPHNVLIDPHGHVKVVDFGIARAAGSSQLTQTGTVAGTAQYLSPEQAQRLPLDGRSDLYSLGVVLFEMLTGRPPFEGDSIVDLALRHIREQPVPPSRLRPGISSATDGIVMRALAKDPAQRFPSAEDMQAALLRTMREIENAQGATKTELIVENRPVTVPPVVPVPAPQPEEATAPIPVRTEVTPAPVRPRQRQRAPVETKRSSLPLLVIPLLLLLGAGGLAFVHFADSPSHHAATGTHATATPKPHPSATAHHRHTAGGSTGSSHGAGAAPAPTNTQQPAVAAAPNPTATSAPAVVPKRPPPASKATATTAPVAAVGLPSTAGAATPTGAVSSFYNDVANHSFGAAQALWTPRLQTECPPVTCINGFFGSTTSANLAVDRVISQTNTSATVQIDLTLYGANSSRHYVGTWSLVRGPAGWLLDSHNLSQETAALVPGPPGKAKGHDKGNGDGNGNGQNGDGG